MITTRHSLCTKMWRDTTITHKNLIQNERREKFLRGNRGTNITTHTDRAGAFGFCAFQQQCIWFNASMHRANPWLRCALYHMCPRARLLFVSGSDDISPKRSQQKWFRLLLFRTQKLSVPFRLELIVQVNYGTHTGPRSVAIVSDSPELAVDRMDGQLWGFPDERMMGRGS